MEAIIGDKKISIELENNVISVNGKLIEPDIKNIGENKFNVIKDHKVYDVEISKVDGKEYEVKVNGTVYPVTLRDKLDLVLEKLGIDQKSQKQNDEIKAPMPGLILNVMANEGDEVKKGDSLFILEAMKMENIIKSPIDGIITDIAVSVGDSVDKNKILCKF